MPMRSLTWIVPLMFALIAGPARAGLPEYVAKEDPTFAWKHVSTDKQGAGTVSRIDLTSQTWRGIAWKHNLTIYEPAELKYPDAVLLFISGGSTTSEIRDKDHLLAFALASACGGRVALLPAVPNQPLYDGKTEDDLISHTFVNYLDSGEEDWPLLQPMVKSAVAAMNAVQAFAKEQGKPAEKFVVTGASKRGWTTWLTGEMDPRVVGIAPMVIPTLNMKAQTVHQMEAWGKYSEQIDDYVRKGLLQQFDTPRGQVLWKLVDPFTYLARLKVPVLQINGTNDRYWTLDSMNLYWDDIKAPHYVVYLPNAGHGLDQNRPYATQGVGALFRHAVTGRPLPEIKWSYSDHDDKVALEVTSNPPAKAIQFWAVEAPDQDFRDDPWKVVEKAADPARASFDLPRKDKGYRAMLGDLTFEVDGLPYHLSTQIRIVSPKSAAAAQPKKVAAE